MRRPIALLLVLATSAFAQSLDSAAPWPMCRLPEDWRPPAPERNPEGDQKITKSPFRNSLLDRRAAYDAGAQLPAPVTKLWRQPAAVLTSWLEREHKLQAVIVTTENAVIVSALPGGQRVRDLPKADREALEAEIPKLGERLDAAATAHLYALRYLRTEARMAKLMGLEGGQAPGVMARPSGHFGLRSRLEFYIFPTEISYREFCKHFFGVFGSTSSWWYEADADAMVACLHTEKVNEPEVVARFEHLVVHNFVQGWRGRLAKTPIWVATGLAGLYERRHPAGGATYLLNGSPDAQWKTAWRIPEGDWSAIIRDLLRSGEDKKLAELAMIQEHVQLPPRHRVQSSSLVAFLLAQGESRFRVFLDELKSPKPQESQVQVQERAIRRAYGVGMPELDQAWRAWTAKTRPPSRR